MRSSNQSYWFDWSRFKLLKNYISLLGFAAGIIFVQCCLACRFSKVWQGCPGNLRPWKPQKSENSMDFHSSEARMVNSIRFARPPRPNQCPRPAWNRAAQAWRDPRGPRGPKRPVRTGSKSKQFSITSLIQIEFQGRRGEINNITANAW